MAVTSTPHTYTKASGSLSIGKLAYEVHSSLGIFLAGIDSLHDRHGSIEFTDPDQLTIWIYDTGELANSAHPFDIVAPALTSPQIATMDALVATHTP